MSVGFDEVNHPNFLWSITTDDLLKIKNLRVFEVYNGHPTVNNVGGGGAVSLDEMWDVLLSAGQRLYGIAVDDAHVFKKTGQEFANPGRGWICEVKKQMSFQGSVTFNASGRCTAASKVYTGPVPP